MIFRNRKPPVSEAVDLGAIWRFLKWGYLQIIHFNRMFHYKLSSYSIIPIFGNPHLEPKVLRRRALSLRHLPSDQPPLPLHLRPDRVNCPAS